MDDIAKLAKISRPTIYRYFPSRHHLAVEVLVREIRDHIRIIIPILREEPYPPKAMIDAIIMAISTARDHPYTRIVTSDAGSELLARVPGSDQSLLDAMGEMWLIRSEEHTSELQSLMRISYAVFCLKKTNKTSNNKM